MDPCLSEEIVAALVDGNLDEARFSAAESHIAQCERCMRLVEEVGAAVSGTRPMGEGEGDEEAPSVARGTLVGRFEVLEAVGAGGMGRVYSARDPTLDRKVALKLLHPRMATADLEVRLLREAKAMARLVHPEVITVYEVGRYGEQLFIAMEFVDGGTLRQWLAAKPRTWREKLDVFLRAGRGLARAHEAGIVHRDFKPDNVLVGSDGRVRVTDFGLARTGDQEELAPGPARVSPTADTALTRTGTLLGTPAYMAPEQHAGTPADARSDEYSFCVALYEALYGERPFGGETAAALFEAKLAKRVRPPRAGGDVPGRIKRALLVGLEPRAADRYASMDALLAALAGATRTPRWPIAAAAAAVVVAGGAIALGANARRHAAEGAAAAGAAAQVAACTSSACSKAHGGEAYVCRAADHACVPVASEDCVAKFEPQDLASDDTVWIGAMFPTKGPGAEDFGTMNMESVDFARSEIASATKSFGGAGAAQRLPRISLVECDDSVDPARAARHLVEDVGVPAILGFRSGQEVVDLAESLLIRRGVISVATLTSSPLITRLPQPGDEPRMVWRTTYSLDAVAAVVASVVAGVLEPRLGSGTTRVTVLRSDVAGAMSFGEKLFRQLRFNGKSALANGAAYAEVTFPPGERSADEIARIADRVAATNPSILVLQGDELTVVPVVDAVETRTKGATRKPIYLASLYPTSDFAPFIGRSAERRHRVYSIESLSSSMVNARFVMRYNDANPRKVTRTFNGGASYDAFYVLAYATFAAGPRATGLKLARGFVRLVGPGEQVEVGPSGIFDGLTTLAKGGTIDLEGTQSGLDFDLTTGDEPSDFALLCPGTDAQGRATGEDVESGIVFRAAKGKLEGTLVCP